MDDLTGADRDSADAQALLEPGARLDRLYTGALWGEGPVWLADAGAAGALRWSDIPNDRILQWDASTNETSEHRTGVEYTNGRTLDRDGRVVQCSHGRRSVEREVGGVVTTLVDRFGDARLNSPNDVVVDSAGVIWFTDPPYGIVSDYEGHEAPQEYGGCFVFRWSEADGGAPTPVVTDMLRPNGLAFSPDESVLYVSDTAEVDGEQLRLIRAYDVSEAGDLGEAGSTGDGRSCTNGRVFVEPSAGPSDGFRIDEAGRVWTSAGSAVQVFSPAGETLLTVEVPEKVANVCFGGADGRELFITASTSLYRIRTTTRQAPRPS